MSTPNVSRLRAKGQATSLAATDIMWVQQGQGSGADKYASLEQIISYLTGGLDSITMTGSGGTAVLTNGSLTFTRVNPGYEDDGRTVKISYGNGLEVSNDDSSFVQITGGKIRVYHVTEGDEHDDFVFDLMTLSTKNIVGTALDILGVMQATAQAITFSRPETHTASESHSGSELHTGGATFQRIAANNLEATSNSSFRGIETHQSTEYHTGIETHGGIEIHNGAASFNALSSKALAVERSVAMSIGDPSVDDERNRSVFPMSASTTGNPYWSLSEYNRVGAIKFIYNSNTTSAYVSFPVRTLAGDQTIKVYQGGCAALLCIDVTSDTLATYAILGDDWNA